LARCGEENGKLSDETMTMKSAQDWIVVRIDGKITSISTDYKQLAAITTKLAQQKMPAYKKITAETVDIEYVLEICKNAQWDDLMLFGTTFQKKVWKMLWDMGRSRILSYSDFAELCENKAGVRAVAHAIGLNPIPIIIPCHLVVPKESIDKIREIQTKAESTIFKGQDLSIKAILEDPTIDFGEYAFGRKLKKALISMDLSTE
jgi:O-6-methylguanine DNA methyltransferase